MIYAVYRFSFPRDHRIAAPVPALPSPSVPFLPRTNDGRDHRAADRAQARCSTRAPQPSGASPHPEFHGCFRWYLHLFSSGTTFLLFVHAADFSKTIHKDAKIG